jgi:hypothetical protein
MVSSRHPEGDAFAQDASALLANVPTPPRVTPQPFAGRSGGSLFDVRGLLGAVQSKVRGALAYATCMRPAPISLATCPVYEPLRESTWKQIERSSNWFMNTCAGQLTRAAAGTVVSGVGLAGLAVPGWQWLSPLIPAGLAIGFWGPPGQVPLEACW